MSPSPFLPLWCALLLVWPSLAVTNTDLHSLLVDNAQSGICRAQTYAPPCAQNGVAGLGSSEPTLNLGVGNPVHLATGAKQQTETDLPAHPDTPDLELVRHFNSLNPQDSVLGVGWRWSYDTRVVTHGHYPVIEQANGSRVTFDQHSNPQHQGVLQRRATGWQWIWPNGRLFDFDPHGHLIRIQRENGDMVTDIVRHTGALAPAIAQVRSGKTTFQFSWVHAHQLTITTPAGKFVYTTEAVPEPDTTGLTAASVRLNHMTRPDGMQRMYLYETPYQSGNAALPTGIVLVQPANGVKHPEQRLRISAWDYDAHARATGVAMGERTAGNGYSRIRYRRTTTATRHGVTVVESPAGQTRFTIALHAGHLRLVSVQGAACPGCAAPGTQASYDAQGRLLSLNQTRLERDPGGQLKGITPYAPGWPGLHIRFSASGAQRAWESTLTGKEQLHMHSQTRSATRQFANQDRMVIAHDAQGLPVRITESRGLDTARDSVITRLQWQGQHLACLQHPHATEWRHTNAAGQLIQRREVRHLASAATQGFACTKSTPGETQPGKIFHVREQFDYDAQGRLTKHALPEGGALHYVWGTAQQLHTITWEDASGTRHPVIASDPGQAGYRYGNGLHLSTIHLNPVHTVLALTDTQGARWQQDFVHNAQGQLLRETIRIRSDVVPAPLQAGLSVQKPHNRHKWHTVEDWHYAYDAQSRLSGAQSALTRLWLAWEPNGALAARADAWQNAQGATTTETTKPLIGRDVSGLPTTTGDLQLHYGANRRLSTVKRHGKILSQHTHNAYGHRIRTQSAHTSTDYLYQDNRLVAQTQAYTPGDPPWIARRYLYAHHVPVGMIMRTSAKDPGTLYAIHADLLGAPRVVTDSQATVRWLARYNPLGEAVQIGGDITLHLRFPGQWLDPATGLHDNGQRTYTPQWGQYLEPDPLGPVPGSQALGYTAQQPRRFVDPMGLLLFAFDGTRHDHRTHSNVMKLFQQYQGGPKYYHAGPGSAYAMNWDAITAYSAPRILETQWFNLLVALKQVNASPWMRDDAGKVPIDIIGFSRGAALARHFGNLIARHTTNGLFSYEHTDLGLVSTCVDLRFMGLMDTVAQFGVNGLHNRLYDLSIAEVWQWVAHAVALHEHQALFPLASTRNTQNPGVIEAGFIGAHGDIGGGNLLDPAETPRQGDLSDVALNWLWWQARQVAGLPLTSLSGADRTIQNPLLHDARPSILRLLQLYDNTMAQVPGTLNQVLQGLRDRGMDADAFSRQIALLNPLPEPVRRLQYLSDRGLFDQSNQPLTTYQAQDAQLGTRTRDRVEPLIRREDHWQFKNSAVVGTVDMAGYTRWLEETLGWGGQLLP